MADYQAVFSDDETTQRSYYDRRSNGDVRWYDWAAGLFFMIVTWFIGQIIFSIALGGALVGSGDTNALAEVASGDGGNVMLAGIGSLLTLVGILTGVIAGLVYYLGKRGPVARVIMLIGVASTFIGIVLSSAYQGDMSGFTAVMTDMLGQHAWLYAFMLLTFPAALVGMYFAWKTIHGKSLTALHTSAARFRWGRALQAFLIGWAVIAVFAFGGGMLTDNVPQMQFDASRFWPYAILSLLLLPIQSATEEIVVRGYMNKGLIHCFGNKWVAFVITSGLFMALHLSNPEATAGAEAGNLPVVMSGYFFFGFAACLMVLIDDGLESAIAVHAANNTFAGIFVNYEGSVLPTPSIWQVKSVPNVDSIGTILFLSTILVILWFTRPPALSHTRTV